MLYAAHLSTVQIAHRPIPASAAALYLGSECIVGYTEVTTTVIPRLGVNHFVISV